MPAITITTLAAATPGSLYTSSGLGEKGGKVEQLVSKRLVTDKKRKEKKRTGKNEE